MNAPTPDDLHIDGLMHLATLAFAMTLVYLGFDKVGDRGRDRLDRDLKKTAKEVGAFLANDERIHNDGRVNELREYVGGWGTRKAICMLLTLANIRHDIYEGFWGRHLRRIHAVYLFLAFRCYLGHWDIILIGIASALSAVAFLSLTTVATFRMSINQGIVITFFATGVMTILLVGLAAYHAAGARSKLARKYRRWVEKYQAWVKGLNEKTLKSGVAIVNKAEATLTQPIAPIADPLPTSANIPSKLD